MDKKIIAFDNETSGIGKKFGLQQFAGIIFINGKRMKTINIQIKIFKTDKIDKKALEVHGLDPTEGLEPMVAYVKIKEFLGEFVEKYNKNDKLTPLAQNGHFDIDSLCTFFNKCEDSFLGSLINLGGLIDPLPFFRMMRYLGKLNLPDLKLQTLCDHFGIKLKAHDALSDIEATVKLAGIVMNEMKNVSNLNNWNVK